MRGLDDMGGMVSKFLGTGRPNMTAGAVGANGMGGLGGLEPNIVSQAMLSNPEYMSQMINNNHMLSSMVKADPQLRAKLSDVQ